MIENCEKLNNQAIVYAQQGEYTEAIACFKRALSMEKENFLLWYNLGLTYRDSGDLKMARKSVSKAYEINSYSPDVIETLSQLCYMMNDLDEALWHALGGIAKFPDNPNMWNALGVIYFNKPDYNLAAEAFENAVTLNPYYYDALYNLRDTYEELGNKAGYEVCTEKMKAIESSN